MRKLTIAVASLVALAACGAPNPGQRGAGFSGIGGDVAAAPAATATATPTAAAAPVNITRSAGGLPAYRKDTGRYRRNGTPATERAAAKVAPDAGMGLFSGPDALNVQVGEFGLGFNLARVDTHTFLVGYRVDTFWRLARQPSKEAVLSAARTLTECGVSDDPYRVTGPSRPIYVVIPLRC